MVPQQMLVDNRQEDCEAIVKAFYLAISETNILTLYVQGFGYFCLFGRAYFYWPTRGSQKAQDK
jgi:hypothetical protein